MRHNRFNFFCFLIIGILGFNFQSYSQKKISHKTYKLSELSKSTPDTCYIIGFVTSAYNCPPCPPPPAICKTCIGDHVTLADDPKSKQSSFMVLTAQPDQYKIGTKYSFHVRLHKFNAPEITEGQVISAKN